MREFLRAKVHGLTVTEASLDYEGSFGMDAEIMKKAGILPFESVEVYNITSGHRLRTYAIELPSGSRRFESNGAAAHWMKKGDKVIVATYTWLTDQNFLSFKGPSILLIDEKNEPKSFYQPEPKFAT